MSYTTTSTSTFTVTHARKLSSKIAADMNICRNYYGNPSEATARDYAEELAQLMSKKYVSEFEFGYKRKGERVVVWRYVISDDGSVVEDQRPGKLESWVDVKEAVFYSYLWHSSRWSNLSSDERERFEKGLPVQRTTGDPPGDGAGFWYEDKNYSSSGVGVSRSTFRPSK